MRYPVPTAWLGAQVNNLAGHCRNLPPVSHLAQGAHLTAMGKAGKASAPGRRRSYSPSIPPDGSCSVGRKKDGLKFRRELTHITAPRAGRQNWGTWYPAAVTDQLARAQLAVAPCVPHPKPLETLTRKG